jgi:exosortase B
MSAVPGARGVANDAWTPWIPVAAALAVLYVPTFYGLSLWVWRQEEHAHGPIILIIVLWLFWRKREALFYPSTSASTPLGFVLVFVGLLAHVVGRWFHIALFEVGALVPILAGVILAMRGWRSLLALWFPIFFIVFMVPLPGLFVDTATGPLKQVVSEAAVRILYPAGYPIARDGVIITIGQYQLLVADACSGLNSMFSLSALGVLYMHLTNRAGIAHPVVMLLSIVPIAFAANVVRVVALILVTYHFGDAAGQGFLHGSAGIVLVLAALGLFLVLDAVLMRFSRARLAR